MRRILFAVISTSAATCYAGSADQAAQVERQAATFYVENCRANVEAVLRAESYYDGKDVHGIVSAFDNRALVEEFLNSRELHKSIDDSSDSVIQRRQARLTEALSNAGDLAKKCSQVGAMYNVYLTMWEAQENIGKYKAQQEAAKAKAAHDKDPVSVDYSVVVKAVGQASRQSRPAKGAVRKLTLGEYIKWEGETSTKWKGELWNAMGMQNKNVVYNRCLASVTAEWTHSFGYADAVLRADMFVNGAVGLEKVLRIVCAPG